MYPITTIGSLGDATPVAPTPAAPAAASGGLLGVLQPIQQYPTLLLGVAGGLLVGYLAFRKKR